MFCLTHNDNIYIVWDFKFVRIMKSTQLIMKKNLNVRRLSYEIIKLGIGSIKYHSSDL